MLLSLTTVLCVVLMFSHYKATCITLHAVKSVAVPCRDGAVTVFNYYTRSNSPSLTPSRHRHPLFSSQQLCLAMATGTGAPRKSLRTLSVSFVDLSDSEWSDSDSPTPLPPRVRAPLGVPFVDPDTVSTDDDDDDDEFEPRSSARGGPSTSAARGKGSGHAFGVGGVGRRSGGGRSGAGSGSRSRGVDEIIPASRAGSGSPGVGFRASKPKSKRSKKRAPARAPDVDEIVPAPRHSTKNRGGASGSRVAKPKKRKKRVPVRAQEIDEIVPAPLAESGGGATFFGNGSPSFAVPAQPANFRLDISIPSANEPNALIQSSTPLSPSFTPAVAPVRKVPIFIPLPKFARNAEELQKARALVPSKLPGYGACVTRRVSARSLDATKEKSTSKGKSRGGRNRRKRQRTPTVDASLVDVEPILIDFVGYQPENKSCVFAGAEYNGITYRIGDHVALHTNDKSGPKWIVVVEGFYAGADCQPMFHGRWYYTRDDVLDNGGVVKRHKLSEYERFSTGARDQNLVESISSRVCVLPKPAFSKLRSMCPSLVQDVYFCVNFYGTETGEILSIPEEALPPDTVPDSVQRKIDLFKKNASANGKRIADPVRVSKRKTSQNLLANLGLRSSAETEGSGSTSLTEALFDCAINDRAKRRRTR